MNYVRPSLAHYRFAQVAAWFVSTFIFRRKILRNEIKGVSGPFVVIANHGSALDFTNLIGTTRRPMTFVISKSIFSTLPIKGYIQKMGMIPKQQFQTSVRDMKQMKAVIDHGQPLVIYPAGLMCEDGLSTPIPPATYKFLKWLGADVYVARSTGTYFVAPKWAKGYHPGRTYMDIYRIFSKEALATMPVEAIREKADEALRFDAYREQEEHMVKYRHGDRVEGLDNVLYMCPNCHTEFSIEVRNGNTLCCRSCGYEAVSDAYGFLHDQAGTDHGLRYVSDWSQLIYSRLRQRIAQGQELSLSAHTAIHMVNEKKKKFVDVGHGTVTLTQDGFTITGHIHGSPTELTIPIANLPTLPFKPGRHFEIQHGSTIYRCVLEDGKLAMKFINMIKIFYALSRKRE